MTLYWHEHLKFKELKWFENTGIMTIILISWDWLYILSLISNLYCEVLKKQEAGDKIIDF